TVNALLVRAVPFSDPDTLVFLWSIESQRPGARQPISYADFNDLRQRTRAFAELSAVGTTNRNLAAGGRPVRVVTAAATPDTLRALGVAPALGRGLLAQDADASATPVVFLTTGFWKRALGGEPTVIGRDIRLDGVAHTVVGILPSSVDEAQIVRA